MNVIDDERFIKVQSILEFSDIHPEDCTKINDLIIELSKERNQFKEYTNHNYDKAKQLEEENHELKEDIKYLFNALTKNDTQMTSKEMDVYDKYYLIFNKKGSKVNGY